MANVLIIDDDRVFCDYLSRRINRLGHNSVFTLTLEDGINMSLTREFDVVLLDVQLPDGDGIEAIPKFQDLYYSPEVIIITGSGNPDGAELAIEWGAWDYIEKPNSVEAITLPLIRALEYRKEKDDKQTQLELNRDKIIGSSTALNACLDQVSKAAKSESSVLIQGETGTGKELLARTIHENSIRAKHPFIVVDCGAIPNSLVEGILFGHEKGVFTGADENKIGLVEQADKGTLFLDEVGELPLSIQKAFLRVLQDKRYRPLGSKYEKVSDFRLVSATNRKLENLVEKVTFRDDLLYRIQSFSIVAPPLRERLADITELSMYYITKQCTKLEIPVKGFSPEFFKSIESYMWPGNIRELFNTLESALTSAGDQPVLYPQHLPLKMRKQITKYSLKDNSHSAIVKESVSAIDSETNEFIGTYKKFRERLLNEGEKHYFLKVCHLSNGNIKTACQISGLSQSRLYYFMKKHRISLAEFKWQSTE